MSRSPAGCAKANSVSHVAVCSVQTYTLFFDCLVPAVTHVGRRVACADTVMCQHGINSSYYCRCWRDTLSLGQRWGMSTSFYSVRWWLAGKLKWVLEGRQGESGWHEKRCVCVRVRKLLDLLCLFLFRFDFFLIRFVLLCYFWNCFILVEFLLVLAWVYIMEHLLGAGGVGVTEYCEIK